MESSRPQTLKPSAATMALEVDAAHQEILDATGPLLVIGGPGSGKTTIALLKAHHRINAGLETGQAILFLSFSRSAVARVGEAARLELPRMARDRLHIQTFHSFFWELLRTHGYLLGAPRRLSLLLPHDEEVRRQSATGPWPEERERLFREEGLTTFDQFAPKASVLLGRSRSLRSLVGSRYPLIIVDEAQDTNTSQWECVKGLAPHAQLVCLADLDQQIYDWMPDVSAERLTEIMSALSPVQVDLEARNHRSPGQEITAFGNDILRDRPRGAPYRGVSRTMLPPQAAARDRAIRSSLGILRTRIVAETGGPPASMAILTRSNRGVAMIARALTGGAGQAPIQHMVLMDEGRVVLASRLVAFLLDGAEALPEEQATAAGLMLCGQVLRAAGGDQALRQAASVEKQAAQLKQGRTSRQGSCAAALLDVIRARRSLELSGVPDDDWLLVRRMLSEAPMGVLQEIAKASAQLATLGLRRRIATGLMDLWHKHGSYLGAQRVLDAAVSEEHLLGGVREMRGTSVMTIHKAKGREFDGVVIFHGTYSDSLVYRDTPPYARSRRLFRVGVTRAKHHVLLLTSAMDPLPPILNGHQF